MTENENKKISNVIPNASSSGKKSPNVPNLRFAEDKKLWVKYLLGNIATLLKGNGISKSDLSETGKPCILYGELYTTYKNEVIREIISKTDVILNNPVSSLFNDVIIPGSGETPEDIATACCVLADNVLYGGDLNIIRLNKGYDGRFISYQLNGKRKFDIARIAQGKSIVHLHNDDLQNLEIFYPENSEIAIKTVALLEKIDSRIETQSKIIEDLELYKNLVSEFLFNIPPSKFSELENFLSKGKAGGTPSSTNKQFYDGEIPFLSISDMTRQGKFITKTEKTISQLGLENSSAWLVPCNSLIFSMYASVGQVAINKIPLTTSQAIFSMVLKNNELLEYLYYFLCYFKSYKLRKFLETGTQSNINADMVKQIKIPDYGDFNKKIARILSIFDKKIQKEKDMLELYKKQKAYLLQNMFI